MVLFDLDGTLIDQETAARRGVTGWLTSQGLATEEQCVGGLATLWDQVAERHFPAFRAREITFQEQRRRRLREFLPALGVAADQYDEAVLDRVFEDYLEHYRAAWSAYEDVLPCLDALQGRRLAVLSNGDQAQQEDKLRLTGLTGYFEAVMTSSALGAAKPHPDAFSRACSRLGVEPEAVIYVGDGLDVDARAATAAGLRGVWLDRPASQGDYKPTITSLQQFPAVVG